MRTAGLRALVLAGLLPAALALAAPAAHADNPYEPNNSRGAAFGPLKGGTPYSAAIDSDSDEDWYVLYTAGPTTFNVNFSDDGPLGCFGPEAYVTDRDGNAIVRAHPPGGYTEQMTVNAPAAARFYVHVLPYYIEPCLPADSNYHFSVEPADALTSKDPEAVDPPADGGGQQPQPTGQASDPTPTATQPVPSKTKTSKLPQPKIRVLSAKVRKGRVVARGRLQPPASLKRLAMAVSGRSGSHTKSAPVGFKRGKHGAWTVSAPLPSSLRSAKKLSLVVAYVGDTRYRARRLTVRLRG